MMEQLFFQASTSAKDDSLTLLIDRCFSTPVKNASNYKKYFVIDNG